MSIVYLFIHTRAHATSGLTGLVYLEITKSESICLSAVFEVATILLTFCPLFARREKGGSGEHYIGSLLRVRGVLATAEPKCSSRCRLPTIGQRPSFSYKMNGRSNLPGLDIWVGVKILVLDLNKLRAMVQYWLIVIFIPNLVLRLFELLRMLVRGGVGYHVVNRINSEVIVFSKMNILYSSLVSCR